MFSCTLCNVHSSDEFIWNDASKQARKTSHMYNSNMSTKPINININVNTRIQNVYSDSISKTYKWKNQITLCKCVRLKQSRKHPEKRRMGSSTEAILAGFFWRIGQSGERQIYSASIVLSTLHNSSKYKQQCKKLLRFYSALQLLLLLLLCIRENGSNKQTNSTHWDQNLSAII